MTSDSNSNQPRQQLAMRMRERKENESGGEEEEEEEEEETNALKPNVFHHGHADLNVLLASNRGIDIFSKHLRKESNVELLFFLIDFVQYKEAFVTEQHLDRVTGFRMELSPNLPVSGIIKQTSDTYQRARAIFEKYIQVGGKRELNLSRACKKRITEQFEVADADKVKQPKHTEYCNRFDGAAVEVRVLINDSFRRFVPTNKCTTFFDEHYSNRPEPVK